MSSLSSEERFKNNLNTLVDITIDMFEEAKDNGIVSGNYQLLNLLKILVNKSSGERIIGNFVRKTHPYWNKILDKDLNYFKVVGLELFDIAKTKGVDSFEDAKGFSLLDQLKGQHIDDFKTILEADYKDENGDEVSVLDDERKEDIWMILHSFVKISIVYIHEKRERVEGKYTKSFFPEIKIKENVEKWKIKSIKY